MHGQLLAYVLQLADGTPDPNAVKVAALSLAGVVVATLGSVFLAFRSPREPRQPRGERRKVGQVEERLERSLEQQRDDAEQEVQEARQALAVAQGRVTAYERFFWLHHMDPNRIVRGDERAEDVRF